MSPQQGARRFHEELEALKATLMEMSGIAEDQVRLATEALKERNVAKARQVIARDEEVDQLEIRIDKEVHELLALQQPLASDLRFLTMTMKASTDLERVGDHATNIARAVEHMTDMRSTLQLREIEEMALLARGMLSDALGALIRKDSAAAREVCARDERLDHLYNSMFRILLTHMLEDPRRIGPAMSLLMVSKNLERIGDLATNLAEDVVFLAEGIVIKHGGGKKSSSHTENAS